MVWLSISVFQVLGIQACTTTHGSNCSYIKKKEILNLRLLDTFKHDQLKSKFCCFPWVGLCQNEKSSVLRLQTEPALALHPLTVPECTHSRSRAHLCWVLDPFEEQTPKNHFIPNLGSLSLLFPSTCPAMSIQTSHNEIEARQAWISS